MGQGHGWQGAVLRLMRGKDYVLTVTGAEAVTEDYRRVHLTDGGLLSATGVHPTLWVRLWFEGPADGLPSRADAGRHEIRTVPREDGGARLAERVRAELPVLLRATPHPYVWIACDTATTRTLAAYVRKELSVPKERTHALGYWRAA